ncbi:complement factor H-like [Gastrophryne carolinensis]
MILLKCLIVLIGILYCHSAPAATARCGGPPVIPNAEPPSNLKEETYEPSKTIIYTCMPGYVRQGSLRLICSDAGKWEFIGLKGVCKKKPCGYPGDAEHGTFELVEGDEFVFGAIVQYKCDNGYHFTTRYTKRECTATGWSNFPPVCEIKQCPPIEVEDNVEILYISQDGENTVGKVVRFECRSSGQTLEGASEIFCTSEAKWNENAPTCKDISCTLPVIDHGNPKTRGQQTFKLKDTLDFECHNGYKPTRTPPTICTASGWSPTPMCEEIVCYLENVANGKIKDPKPNQIYRLGETVELECSRDFQPEGDPDEPRRCTSYGWSPSLKCISKQCHRPDIPNGKVAAYNYWGRLPSFPLNVGDYFYYSCDREYSPTHRYDRQYGITYCGREGWNPPPGCSKQCSIPSPEERKALISAEKEYFEGDTMAFRCYEGYKTKDKQTSGVMTCLNGKFTEEKCIRVCQKPDVKNGFINTTETEFEVGSYLLVTCHEGFNFGKNKVKDNIQCTNNNWNPNPVCTEITCQVNRRTFKSGDVVHFTCAKGQTLQGHSSSQCYYFGWGPSLPKCQRFRLKLFFLANT